jgi:hypothetical protein
LIRQRGGVGLTPNPFFWFCAECSYPRDVLPVTAQ